MDDGLLQISQAWARKVGNHEKTFKVAESLVNQTHRGVELIKELIELPEKAVWTIPKNSVTYSIARDHG